MNEDVWDCWSHATGDIVISTHDYPHAEGFSTKALYNLGPMQPIEDSKTTVSCLCCEKSEIADMQVKIDALEKTINDLMIDMVELKEEIDRINRSRTFGIDYLNPNVF